MIRNLEYQNQQLKKQVEELKSNNEGLGELCDEWSSEILGLLGELKLAKSERCPHDYGLLKTENLQLTIEIGKLVDLRDMVKLEGRCIEGMSRIHLRDLVRKLHDTAWEVNNDRSKTT